MKKAILREAAGKSLRGMTLGDARRYVKYALDDGAISAGCSVNAHNAIYALEWLVATGRLSVTSQQILTRLCGAALAGALERVIETAKEPTISGYAEEWKWRAERIPQDQRAATARRQSGEQML